MPAKGSPAWHAAQKAQAGPKAQVDKTFGMKNKKGKAVQAKFHTQNGGADNAAQEKRRAEMKKAEQEALNALLFQEAKKKNEKNKEKVKKEEKKKEEDKEPTEMLARIEWLKKRTTTRTPVTLDRLKAWLERKKAKKEAERLAKLGNAKAALSSGKKLAGVTGRELFQVDSTLFVDDAEAAEDTFDERTGAGTLSDDEEGGEEGAARAGGGEAAAGSHPGASVSDLVLGERVEGRYMGGKAWYGGVVRAVAADGTATIEYEDGDIEESVPRDFIRPLDRAPPAAAAGDAAGGSGAAGPSAAGTSAAGASAAAAADAVALVEDESLFADDDFPEDDELGAAAAPAAGKAPAAGGKAPAAAVDLNAVDESLFLDEDLPSDDD